MDYGAADNVEPKLMLPLDGGQLRQQRPCSPVVIGATLPQSTYAYNVNSIGFATTSFPGPNSTFRTNIDEFRRTFPPANPAVSSASMDEAPTNSDNQNGLGASPYNHPIPAAALQFQSFTHSHQIGVHPLAPLSPISRKELTMITNGSFTAKTCRACGNIIRDKHMLCVHRPRMYAPKTSASEGADDGVEYWHEQCLRCSQCFRHLSTADETCFVRDGRIYCREDHAKLVASSLSKTKLCFRCAHPISPNEFIFRSGPSYVYHVHCFKCSYCGNALAKGDKYINAEGQLICQNDLKMAQPKHQQQQQLDTETSSAEALPLQGPNMPHTLPQNAPSQIDSTSFLHIPPFPELDFSTLQRPNFHHQSDRSKKIPKRPRTILNAPQRKAFKIAFEKGPKPSRKVREQLARETGLSVRVVQVWFQNQRAKMKKEKKRELDKLHHGDVGGRGSVSTSTDSDRKEDGEQIMPKSPQSESVKSEIMAGDMEYSDAGCDDSDEEDNNGKNLTEELFSQGDAGAENLEEQEGQQNPIQKIHHMYQTYFAFV